MSAGKVYRTGVDSDGPPGIDCPVAGAAHVARVNRHGERVSVRCLSGCDPKEVDKAFAPLKDRVLGQLKAMEPAPRSEDSGAALEALSDLLGLGNGTATVKGARIVGKGGSASADLYLTDGTAIEFEHLRDVGRPGVLAVEIAAATGATPKLTGPLALRAVSLLRAIAEHEVAYSADELAREWGTTFLQEAQTLDVDMADQQERWGAFCALDQLDPVGTRNSGEAGSIARACRVLRSHQGHRYVRTGWFRAHVRSEDSIGSAELANRMQRVGWVRPGSTGRIKATNPSMAGGLVWTFYRVPADWEGSR
jgi:hypothetical protein